MKLIAAIFLLGFAFAPNSAAELQVERRAKSSSGSLKGTAVNPFNRGSSVCDQARCDLLWTACNILLLSSHISVPVAGSRSESSDDEQIATIKVPTSTPSTTPSITPSSTPTSAPSAAPTNERWCNMEYERDCRDSCFKEHGCGINDACKKKCRKQCCSWD